MSAEDTRFPFLAETSAQKHPVRHFILWRSVWQSAVLRRLARILGWLSLAGCVACGLLYVVARAWLFPWLGENREWVAAKLSGAVGAPVSIERLEADWAGLRPRLRLGGLTIRSGESEALRLERVEATLSWMSLPRWMPYFRALEIIGPEVGLARDKDGVFTVAGIRMEPNAMGRGNPIAWLFDQSRIVVRDATLVWDDGLRAAPPLRLAEVQFSFERGLFSHHLELQARPPEELAAKFDIRGDVRRYDFATLDKLAGQLSIGLENADLGGWSAWVDYPVPCKGRGRVNLLLDSNGEGTVSLSADLDLTGIETTLAPGLAPLQFDRLSGRVLASQTPKSVAFGARSLWLESKEVSLGAPIDVRLELHNTADSILDGGALSVSLIDLATFIQLSRSLPLDKYENARALLDEFNPKGRLRALSFEWEGESGALQDWKINTEFEGIGLTARGIIPGMGNMSGRIKGNSREGEFVFSSRDSYVDFPKVFEQARVPVTSLDASGGWNRKSGQLAVTLDAIEVANDDAAGRAKGSYWPAESGSGEIDITGRLTRAQGAAVWRYIPIIAGENVHNWIKGAITRASITGAEVKLKGSLDRFPFRDGKDGVFSVVVQASNGRLDYAKGWPALDRLDGELHFKGPGLLIESRGGDILGVRVEPIRVEIPDFKEGVMTIEGAANGPSADFLRFIAESPLAARLHNFTEPLRPEGNGQLGLKLVMPLHDLDKTEVSGEYRFAANRVRLDGIAFGPALEAAEGNLGFTGDGLNTLSIRGRLLGGECTIKGKTGAGGLELSARGQVEAAAAREAFGWPILRWIGGNTPWSAEMVFSQNNGRIAVRSDLKGLHSRLPAPFAKEADDAWPLEVMAASQGAGKPQSVTVKMGIVGLEAVLERNTAGEIRGGVGLRRPTPTSSNGGVHVAALLDTLDMDAWQWSLTTGESEGDTESEDSGRGDGAPPLLTSVMLDAQQVRAFGYTFNALHLRAANNAESWTAHLDSKEAQGVISWRREGDGVLSARLSRLALSGDEDSGAHQRNGSSSAPPPRGLPGLDVRAEEFAVGARELGRLEVRATNQKGAWQLDNFSIRHSDAQFSGNGLWQPGAQHSTLDFTLDVTDVGRFATALGYSDIVQGGQARLAGKLDWDSSPTRIDYPTLSGQIELDARNGRFNRLEPGVGRLLGVLSLQALPRRLTLDFRDVFSEGFVFDRIEGKTTVSGGMMRSDGIEIVGPAARVRMRGQTDITAETQELQVTVRPALSSTVAIGAAAIVNPIAGAVAFITQKALGSPVERLFSYDYRITGSWADPVVVKTGSSPVPVREGEDGGKQRQENSQPSQ
ncbi:MAG: TIGR02099 family protein [Betaproteobacteria bacterium]|nr:TIGR02099 family protein [Betaproteobacteria bacterium]